MRPKNQVIAPKTRRLERTFDEFLLCLLTLLLISFLSLFLLAGYGINLFLSEPESLKEDENQKTEIRLRVKGAEFKLTFNEKALSGFPPGSNEPEIKPDATLKQQLPPSHRPKLYKTQFSNPPASQSNKDLYDTNPLRDFKVKLKKDTIIMTAPLTLAGMKKTIKIEENLEVEDRRLAADIKNIQIGKLPIPGFVATCILDSLAPHFINHLAQKIGPKTEKESEKLNIPIDPNKFELSKMIMPPTLLVLFGPKDFLKTIVPKEWAERQNPEAIQTVEISNVEIDEGKITITGSAQGIKQLTYLTISILKMKWKDLGR